MDALAIRSTPAEMTAVFAAAEADIRAAFASIRAAEDRLHAVFSLGESHRSISVYPSTCHHAGDFDDPDQAIERMTRAAWRQLVEKLELRVFMSSTAYDAIERDLNDRKVKWPAITEANLQEFARHHWANRHAMLKTSVGEVFEMLRPGEWEPKFKTNARFEIGPKVILTGVINGRFMRVDDHYSTRFTSMENVFTMLDGQGTINKTYYSALQTAMMASTTGAARTPYFDVKWFNNGNCHLTFLRLDLLAKFNALAGGKNLRSSSE